MDDPKHTNQLDDLKSLMVDHFNLEELNGLCFSLEVDSEELEGKTKPKRVQSLIEYVNRRNRLPELMKLLKEERPNVPWEGALYQVIDLGTLGVSSFATDINEYGQVVGYVENTTGRNPHPFIWQDGRLTDLDIRGAAYGINDQGQIVGSVITELADYGTTHLPALWNNGNLIVLDTVIHSPVKVDYGKARDINNSGQIVGESGYNPAWRATLWNPEAYVPVDLTTEECKWESAFAINTHGKSVGQCSQSDIRIRDINDKGVSVGAAQMAGGNANAFKWKMEEETNIGQFVDSQFPDTVQSSAHSINNHGDIVGYWEPPSLSGRLHATLWHSQLGFVDLNNCLTNDSPLHELTEAWAINNHGWIVGFGFSRKDNKRTSHAFLMRPR